MLWLVVYVELTPNGVHQLHPLCVCATEQLATVYIEHIETRFPKALLSYMELPYWG